MRTCEACGRDFVWYRGRHWTCPHCGYNTHPRSKMPRSEASLVALEQEQQEREEAEADLHEYLDLD